MRSLLQRSIVTVKPLQKWLKWLKVGSSRLNKLKVLAGPLQFSLLKSIQPTLFLAFWKLGSEECSMYPKYFSILNTGKKKCDTFLRGETKG